MEENTSKVCSTKSCCFCFAEALKAGFIASVIMNILLFLQGSDTWHYYGTFLGDVDLKIIYVAGFIIACILGIIFACLYALIIAPLSLRSHLIKALIFAAILTAISYFVSPLLPQRPNMNTNRAVAVSSSNTDIAVKGESPDSTLVDNSEKTRTRRILALAFTNSLLFALMVVVLYKRRYCVTDKVVIKDKTVIKD